MVECRGYGGERMGELTNINWLMRNFLTERVSIREKLISEKQKLQKGRNSALPQTLSNNCSTSFSIKNFVWVIGNQLWGNRDDVWDHCVVFKRN